MLVSDRFHAQCFQDLDPRGTPRTPREKDVRHLGECNPEEETDGVEQQQKEERTGAKTTRSRGPTKMVKGKTVRG